MAGPAGRSPEEDTLLQTAMRVLPGGVLGGYYAPQELAFVVREARGPRLYDFSGREYIDYRATLSADQALHAAFTRELLTRGVVKAAQKFYVSLAHTDAEVTRTLDVFGEALSAVAGTSP